MQLGMIGLGRMGANLVRRLMRDGHECVVYDVDADAVRQLEDEGAIGAASLDDFVAKLSTPRGWRSATSSSTAATATTATTSIARRRSSRRESTTSTSARAAVSSASSAATA